MHDETDAPSLPPEPTRRAITPAPEDYRRRLTFAGALWSVGWLALAALLVIVVASHGSSPGGGHAH